MVTPSGEHILHDLGGLHSLNASTIRSPARIGAGGGCIFTSQFKNVTTARRMHHSLPQRGLPKTWQK